MEGITEDVAAIRVGRDVSSSPAPEVPEAVRQSHARIIVDLLIALNFPERRLTTRRAHQLPPLRLRADPSSPSTMRDEDESRTPTRAEPHEDEERDEIEEDEDVPLATTPKLNAQRTLPKIADLLNRDDVAPGSGPRGAGGRRIMDVDV